MDYRDIFDLILDEADFTVGGGSSAAIAGAMACGLMGMVANLSKGKDYGHTDEQYDQLIAQLGELKAALLQGAVQDNEAYLMIKAAYKMPKVTEQEKQLRKKAINDAGIAAARVPLSNASLNKKVHEIGLDLLKNSNPACETDLSAGVELSVVGLHAGIANVKVNLPLIKDEAVVKALTEKVQAL